MLKRSSSRSIFPIRKIQAQPPGPGFFKQAPSVTSSGCCMLRHLLATGRFVLRLLHTSSFLVAVFMLTLSRSLLWSVDHLVGACQGNVSDEPAMLSVALDGQATRPVRTNLLGAKLERDPLTICYKVQFKGHVEELLVFGSYLFV